MINTRKAGSIAANALFWANARALYALAKCDYCGVSVEDAVGMAHDRFGYVCGECDR